MISISDQISGKELSHGMMTPKKSQEIKGYSQTEHKDDKNATVEDQNNFEFKSGKKDSLTVSEHLENIFQNRPPKEKQSIACSGRKHHTLEDFLDS